MLVATRWSHTAGKRQALGLRALWSPQAERSVGHPCHPTTDDDAVSSRRGSGDGTGSPGGIQPMSSSSGVNWLSTMSRIMSGLTRKYS